MIGGGSGCTPFPIGQKFKVQNRKEWKLSLTILKDEIDYS